MNMAVVTLCCLLLLYSWTIMSKIPLIKYENTACRMGILCSHRLNKLKYVPKSCYKANLHALLFLAEYKKKNIDISSFQPLINYFINRNIFYKSSDKASLVLSSREG